MEFQIRKGNLQDMDAFLKLLYDAKEATADPEWFFLDPEEEIRGYMRDGVMELWIAMDGERMAAGFDLLHLGLDPVNYGYDLDFTEEELLRAVQMDTAAVHPDYRGHGLQRMLMGAAEEEIRKQPGRILLSTVHPDNVYSLNNMQKLGYGIGKKVEKYGSVRYVMRKDLP